MKRTMVWVLALSVAVAPSLSAVRAATPTPGEPVTPQPGPAPPAGPTPAEMMPATPDALLTEAPDGAVLSATDKAFIQAAASAALATLAASHLAAQRAALPEVKAYGREMVAHHTQMMDHLAAIAARKRVKLPDKIDAAQQDNLARLSEQSGEAFDSAFMAAQVADHQAALALFRQEAAHGSDPDLVALAKQAVPTIQQHLQMAQDGGKGRT